MSLFRTLQHSPATISIFHNGKSPLSVKLYEILESAQDQSDDKFRIDLAPNQLPTFDQYQLIYANCLQNDACKKTLSNAYPFLSDSPRSVVQKAGPAKVFTSGEYSLISEVFRRSLEHAENTTEKETGKDPEYIFRAPLVVDWDQNLIAGDESSLKDILKKYQV